MINLAPNVCFFVTLALILLFFMDHLGFQALKFCQIAFFFRWKS